MSVYQHPAVVHWLHDPFWGALSNLACLGLRPMPCKLVSGLGARLGVAAGRHYFPLLSERSDRNLRLLRPELAAPARAALVDTIWANAVRIRA